MRIAAMTVNQTLLKVAKPNNKIAISELKHVQTFIHSMVSDGQWYLKYAHVNFA